MNTKEKKQTNWSILFIVAVLGVLGFVVYFGFQFLCWLYYFVNESVKNYNW